jgi:hypothetical protein
MRTSAPRRAARPAARAARTATAAGLAALMLLAGLLATAGAAAADDVTWTVRTASNAFGSDRTGYTYAIDPGASVDDALVVANHGPEALTLTVYASDGYTTDDGQFDLLTPDQEPTGIGAWTTAGSSTITVEPGATVEVPFTVTVPADATPGDYAGGILTSLVQADDAAGISVDRRLGIRMNLRVGGALAPSLVVEDLHVDYTGTVNPAGTGTATVGYTLHNTGNTVISAAQAVAVAGPLGRLRAEATDVAVPPDLLPGETWTVSVPVDGVVPAVRIVAEVTVTPVVTDASGSTAGITPVVASAGTWAVPWTALALLVLLVAAAVLLPRVLRRRRRLRLAREDARVEQAVADALRTRTRTERPVGPGPQAGPDGDVGADERAGAGSRSGE